MGKSLVQKFKMYTNADEVEIDMVYKSLYVDKFIIFAGNNFSLETDLQDRLVLNVIYRGSETNITFGQHVMYVEVTRDSQQFYFEMEYDISKEWLFQLSTKYDLGFIEHRYMKYLNLLNDFYSVDYDD